MPGNHALSPVLRYLHGISCQTEYFWLLPHSKCLDKFARFPFTNKIELIIKPVLRQGLYAMSSCAYLCFCHHCVLVGHWPDWPSSALRLASVSGQSASGPVRPGPAYSLRWGLIALACWAAVTWFYFLFSFHLSDVIAVVYWRCIWIVIVWCARWHHRFCIIDENKIDICVLNKSLSKCARNNVN